MGQLFRGSFPKATVFDELPDHYLDWLAPLGRVFSFQPGEVLVRQAEPNEWLHVIMTGRVGLKREVEAFDHPLFLEQLGPGELVGEYGLVDQRRTPYTARAITAVQTLRFQHLAIAYTMYYQFRDLVPTFQTALRQRIGEATLRGAVLLRREGPDPYDGHDLGVSSGNRAATRAPDNLS